ncbi:MAG: DUF2855 family protein [Ahrensia sp.]|nr:DUF2855 family protein [Ahrensia sp.]
MKQFQITKADMAQSRLVALDEADLQPGEGEVLVAIERFGFSANNITYAATGERIGYWQFFPPQGDDAGEWGVVPVWGFADVITSNCADIPVGERLFGYFPPATHLKMRPEGVASGHFFDAMPHRAALPRGYNIYRRVSAEPGYDRAQDDLRMLLFPLYLTAFVLWDQLKEHNWYGAEQIALTSASSKTSIGLAYALHGDPDAPRVIGLTSAANAEFVQSLGIYDRVIAYDDIAQKLTAKPTTIVDMAGNADVLGNTHAHLGEAMMRTLNVGLTHWDIKQDGDGGGADGKANINRDRSEFFFAPSRIQQRMKDWGAAEFDAKSLGFVRDAVADSASWLTLSQHEGLAGFDQLFADMRDNKVPPTTGLVILP